MNEYDDVNKTVVLLLALLLLSLVTATFSNFPTFITVMGGTCILIILLLEN